MNLRRSIKVMMAGWAWRSTGRRQAGETLLEVMSHGDEQERMLAGMSLVKGGLRTVGLIEEKAAGGDLSADAVRLLPDIGGPEARSLLGDLQSADGEIGAAARSSLELLERIERMGAEEGDG